MNYPLTPCGKFFIVPQTQHNIDACEWCIGCDLADEPLTGTGCNKSEFDSLEDIDCMHEDPEQIFKFNNNHIHIEKVSLHDHVKRLYGE